MGLKDFLTGSVNDARAATTEGVRQRVERGMQEGPAPQPARAASAPQADAGQEANPKRMAQRKAGPPASMLNKYANGGMVRVGKASTPYKCK